MTLRPGVCKERFERTMGRQRRFVPACLGVYHGMGSLRLDIFLSDHGFSAFNVAILPAGRLGLSYVGGLDIVVAANA